MDKIMETILSNPFYIIITAILLLLLVGAIFKRLIKLAVFILVLVLIYFGYLYFTGQKIPLEPQEVRETIQRGVEKAQTGAKEMKRQTDNLMDDLKKTQDLSESAKKDKK
ncbi:MAG: hypothetical protein PHR06_13280 [Candidatus Cloacimonetes bacterium]|nr:hypothetical protein [Candidatus Cloacimonadota bacterium]